MDHEKAREKEFQCIQEQPPECTAACPVHVDARGMIAAVAKNDFNAAFSIFNRTIPFPGIIGRICDHPCEHRCKRNEAGAAIRINALERASVEYGRGARKSLFLSRKDTKVAVIGSGLSGLTAAFDLSSKGYHVEIFEAGHLLGGRIREFDSQRLPEQVIDDDLFALEERTVVIHRNVAVTNGSGGGASCKELLSSFDAVYIGPGPHAVDHLNLDLDLTSDNRIRTAPVSFQTSMEKVFSGGSQRYHHQEYSPITSLLDGRLAAASIDRYLQKASLTARREQDGPLVTSLYTNTKGIESLQAVPMTIKAQGYSREEARSEARRCLNCQCLECVKVCEYLAHYGSYPKRYVREIYNNDSIIMGAHLANRMVNSCSLCGLCKEVCPTDLNMADVCLDARQSMVARGKMPPSVHDFAIRDMQFSMGPSFSLARHEPGCTSSSAVFYPGCQLSASLPRHVSRTYEHLRRVVKNGVGLMLGCCGAPARWAGQEDLFHRTLDAFMQEWQRLGGPRVITACSSCYRLFKDNLPGVPVESLWTVLDAAGLPPAVKGTGRRTMTIHDPCTARHENDIQRSIRRIADSLGVEIRELKDSYDMTPCCGYGGLMSFANPEVTDKVVKRRISESELDYLVYCAMCRDNFAKYGKRVQHILDLLFGSSSDTAAQKGPGWSQRRENRAMLKAGLLRELWGEETAMDGPGIKLIISPEIQAILERRMILEEDLQQVVRHAEKTGEKIKNLKTGRILARYRPVSVTYWVEYSIGDSGIVIHNAYSHRMEVFGEGQ
ncbi:MAG TPA: heterodisulfide reductase-related iron-sulfur binding cluster [Nitrospirota bacterium]|nr:heterodisulfide reductase-related iron-sulfur binding cluster [Nitrospirota bacterium]